VKLYYERGDIRLWHGDCLEWLESGCFGDAAGVLTDPPYGIKACDRSDGGVGSISSGSKFYGRAQWDHQKADPEVISILLGLSVPTVIWGGNYYGLPPASCVLVWDKMQRDFSFADAELAWTNLDRAVRCFSYSRGQLTAEGKIHPTQKPVPLIEWCLGFMPQGTILDAYSGSCSTAIGCIRTGRPFVGCEVDERWCEESAKRIDRELDQGRLFTAPAPKAVQRSLMGDGA
jgi:DNA modification methylase